jgi:hypothetical protein
LDDEAILLAKSLGRKDGRVNGCHNCRPFVYCLVLPRAPAAWAQSARGYNEGLGRTACTPNWFITS